jgi:hypothetical protein
MVGEPLTAIAMLNSPQIVPKRYHLHQKAGGRLMGAISLNQRKLSKFLESQVVPQSFLKGV